jgi:hypothetical protein
MPRLGAGILTDRHTIKRVEESEVGFLLKSIKNRKKIAMLKSQGKSRKYIILYILYIS